MRNQLPIFALLLLLLGLGACEEEYTPEDVFDEPQLVVEGYVEYGPGALPPYVILTQSSPYIGDLSPDRLAELFVHDADVRVSDGENEVQLTEFCLGDLAALDTALAQTVAEFLGLGGISVTELEYCIYIDIFGFLNFSPLEIEPGRSYSLVVRAGEDSVSAVTTLAPLVGFDSLYYVDHPDYPENDSLVELRASVTDPAGEENYYRVFTKRNEEPFYPLLGQSVTDDKIFDGRVGFEIPVQRGQSFVSEFDLETAGYYWRGDTAVVRVSNIDYPHFRFWQTFEYSSGSQGPFGNYVRIESNIQGGLGVWGGLHYEDYELIIPR